MTTTQRKMPTPDEALVLASDKGKYLTYFNREALVYTSSRGKGRRTSIMIWSDDQVENPGQTHQHKAGDLCIRDIEGDGRSAEFIVHSHADWNAGEQVDRSITKES